MDRYVEVIGEGQYTETAARFIAEVGLEVRAAKDETALREMGDLCREALAVLREIGIADDEIVEGGADLHRPWYHKKQVGQSALRKIILKVKEYARLQRALELLEPLQLQSKDRKTISVDMRQPEFEESAEIAAKALADAFENAKAKALRLVAAMNCRLGRPLRVEEGGLSKRNSGFAGDEDWGGDSSRFGMGMVLMAGGAADGSLAEPEIQRPTRTIYVKCRVRFSVDDGD